MSFVAVIIRNTSQKLFQFIETNRIQCASVVLQNKWADWIAAEERMNGSFGTTSLQPSASISGRATQRKPPLS